MADRGSQRTRIAPGATAEQTAAIVAALERFWRATSRAPRSAAEREDPWLRAAILEGVSRRPSGHLDDPWINT